MIQQPGEIQSTKLSQRIEEIEQQIKQIQSNLAVPEVITPKNIDFYMNVGDTELASLSSEECEGVAIFLKNYSFKLQTESNRWHALVGWCESNIRYILADKVSNYNGYSYDERRLAALKENPIAKDLEAIRVNAQLHTNSLYNLSERVYQIAVSYSNLSNRKSYAR